MDSPRKEHVHRPHKRSSFRMPISRRFRAEFTPLPQTEPDSPDGGERVDFASRRSVKGGGYKGIRLSEFGTSPRKDRPGVSPRRDKCGILAKREQEETTRLLDKASTETEDGDELDIGLRKSGGKKGTKMLAHSGPAMTEVGEDNVKHSGAICEKMKREKKEQGEEIPDDKRRRRELGLIAAAERKWRRRDHFDLASSVREPFLQQGGSRGASNNSHYKRGSGPCEFEAGGLAKWKISSFRSRRKSFGSESEKRRGERFQREREMEQTGHLNADHCPSEDEDDDFETEEESSDSASHVCDFSCPLVLHGPCPKSLPGGKKKLNGGWSVIVSRVELIILIIITTINIIIVIILNITNTPSSFLSINIIIILIIITVLLFSSSLSSPLLSSLSTSATFKSLMAHCIV
ncbi:hypothetical protein ElyMa_001230100 [Elysia marginata]|uniref:Uncharacterized protein n=1 Tax=Elysia marginata TaxID=1093978 RepID=A0AAV4I880_9GAST|nr:hypothetical protein ElyMa_001230100 [Elysia marginata]